MSRVRQEVASVIFQADARKANASMEALQEKANSLNDAITGVKQQIEALGNVAPDHQGLISYQQQLRKLNSDLKDVQKTMSDYMRGVKAADQLWQSYMRGDIEGLSLKAIKAGQNGLRKRMENLSPGNPDDQKTLRAYEEVIKEADLVVNKFKTDAAETIQILRDGGTVSEQAMKKARDGVKSLMETVEEGSQEYRQFSQQYEYLAAKVVEFTEAQRRAKGEIVDANDARRAAVRLTREGAEAAAREREAQDAVITAQQKEIEQTRALRQEKEKEIEQTNSQMATNMRLADAAMAERRQMEDDYQASLGAIAAEKRQQAQQQAQAAHDEADRMRANAQIAQQTAQQKRTAYEQETQAVNRLDGEVKQLRTEVQGLTDDIRKMGEVKAEPKIDTSQIDELKQKIESLNAEKKQLEEKMTSFKYYEDMARAYKPFEDIFNRVSATFGKIEKLPQITGRAITMGDGSPFKKSAMSANFYSNGDIDFDKAYAQKAYEIQKVMQDIQDHSADYLGDSGFVASLKKDYEAIRDAVSYGKRLQGVEENITNPTTAQGLERRVSMMEKLKEVYKEMYDLILQHGRTIAGKYGDDIYEERVAETAEEKERAGKRLVQIDGELIDAQTKLAAAQQQSTQATDAETESVKKLNQELEGLEQKQSAAQKDLERSQGNLQKSLEPLKEMGLAEEDLENKAKLREAAEKKVLEIMEAQANVEKEVAEQQQKLISELKDTALGGTKADHEFYMQNRGKYALENYATVDDAMERISHLEMVSKIKNGKKFSDDTYWDPDDELDESDAIVMTDKERAAINEELRILKQHVRETILKTIREVGDISKAVEQETGGDGVDESSKFGEQLNDRIDALKEKIQEQITTTLEGYADILDDVDRDEKLSKEEITRRVNSHIEYLGENVARDQDDVDYFKGQVEKTKEQIATKKELIEQTKAQAQAEKESATTSDELQRKQTELAAKTDELAQAKQRQAKAQGEMNTAEQQAAKAQDDANQKQVEAIQLGEKAAQANDEAAKAEESHNAVLQRQDEKIAKLQNDYDALDDTLRKQEGELTAYDQKVAQSEQAIAEAERKKAQARELSAKDMRDAIAALRERNDAIGEANPEWEKNERLIAQYNQRLEEMKQRSAELRGEVMSLSDALGMAGTIDGGGASVEKMEQAIKTLTEAKRKATDQKDFDEYGAAIDKISQKLKEATSEWMSLSRAEEIARKAGENYYLSEGKSGFVASPEEIQKATQALERQREAVIKNIQQKKANKNATDEEKKALADEEKKLQDLTKKLRDLKFEQDNVNMSQEKMRMLMKQPAQAVSLDELRAAIKRADGELRRMEGSLGKNSKEYKAFAEQVKTAKNTLKDMEGAAKASASAWEKAVSRLKTYVGLYMGFNIFWQKVTGTAGDLLTLSDKMGEVRKTTQMTADQVGRLSDALTKLDTRTSLTGLMEFSSLAGSIGLKTQEDVQGFTEAANMLSVSLPELGNEASRTLMKIADATGDLEKNGNNVRETLERVGSTVIALRANSAAAAGPITDFVSRVGAVGAQAGISIDQIAALGATVDALGGRVEMSATALSRMIPAIRNNTFEVAQAIGMTEKQLKSKSGIDQMVAVFKALHDSVKNFDMTTEEGMNAAADAVEGMLGRSVSMQDVMKQLNQQGARAGIVFGLLSQNVDTLEKQLGIAGEAYKQNTALMDEYNKMNDTAAAKWERLKNQMEEMFVSDKMQRFLGGIITALRTLVDFISGNVTGAVHALHIAVISLATGFGVLKTGIGAAFVGMGGLATAFTNLRITIGLAIGDMGRYIALKWALVRAHDEEAKAAIRAKLATMGATKAMMANVVLAFVAALGMLVWKLYEAGKAAKEAAAETGRFNQQIADEQKALGELFKPLDKSNTAQEERLRLINEINSKYGKYLGYMLSETSSAIALADAHALIAKRIREEALERRLAEQEKKVYEKHDEDLNAAYGGIESAVRGGAKGNADIQAIADMFKRHVDNNMEKIIESGKSLPKGFVEEINGMTERLVQDGKLTRDGANDARTALYKYLDEAKSQAIELRNATQNIRSDLRGIQNAIQTDLANNLNNLVNNVINSANNIVRQMPGPVSQYLGRPEEQKGGLPSLFGGSQQGGTSWKAPWQQQQQTTPKVQKALEGWKPNINKKDPAAVRQLVQDQDALRSGLQGYTGPNREAYESWLIPDKDLAEYRKLMQQQSRTNGGGGGGGGNLYGDYNKVTSPYKEWNGNDLVNRRKEMLERVKALANGADVQAVLSEDAKFISDAVRKNIKTTEQAIEWYNTERLKIQDALHAKHLTNTGDWMDPEKVRKRVGRVVNDEMKYYLDELDAYYTERKAKIEEARSNEEITEGEAWRRNLKNENEWYQRRAELLKLYANKSAEVTEKEQDAIFDIISERTGETTAYIKQDIGQTVKFINDVGTKSKAAMDRILGDIDLKTEQARLKSQQAIGKQMKFIEDTLAKERPYDSITKNLQDNLDKMGVLAARMRRVNDELTAEGKEPKFSNAEITAQSYKEMAFYLKQAGEAYSIDVNTLLRRMAEEGMAETAKEIEQSDMLKQAVMGQLRKTYQEVQDAIKKEASQIKKDVEILWNDETLGPDGRSIKATFDKAIAQLGMQQDSVSRANSLIGAGTASDNVATRLAMKQIEVQMRMQKAQFDMFRNQANQRMAALKAEAKEHERIADLAKKEGDYAEEARERTKATNALRDAENVKRSLGLTLAEETKKEEEQKAELLKLQEESQNRLYQSLREWADLLTSSIQGVMEASHAGDAEYYNERAKLDLTGKGGPGAGTYVVIDDAGTSDARAHYEYLDERQALEREHEIEQQNAQAEAWRKLMDDFNMKLSEQITDWINAAAQQAALNENTAKLKENADKLAENIEKEAENTIGLNTNVEALNTNTGAIQGLTAQLAQGIKINTGEGNNPDAYREGGNGQTINGGNMGVDENGVPISLQVPAATEETPGYGASWMQPPTTEGTEEQPWFAPLALPEEEQNPFAKYAEWSSLAKDSILGDQQQIKEGQKQTDKQNTKSTQSAFAKMSAAANLYGVAYQAMANDNLDATQKFQMIALQTIGSMTMAGLDVLKSQMIADAAAQTPGVLGKLWNQLGYWAAPVFAVFTGLLGGLMGLATSKISSSKSQIASVTGASVGAGRLATGMLTYAEGNVNEFTDPASLTPGRQYNVDGADGKTYRARYMGKDAKTHITNGPEFHLVGEKGREAIIDAHTTRLMQTDDTGIWQAIQTLYNGGRVSGFSTRRGRGVRAFAEGNINDFEDISGSGMEGAEGFDDLTAMQDSLDRNTAVQEALLERLNQPIVAQNVWTGPEGIPNMVNKYQKEAKRHGVKYL